MRNVIWRLLQADGFLAKVAGSFALTLSVELLVALATALFGSLQTLGPGVLMPKLGLPLLHMAIFHVLRPDNLGLIVIVAIAWQIAPLLLNFARVGIARVMNRVRPARRRVGVRPAPVTFDWDALKEKFRRMRKDALATEPSPA